MKTRLKQIQMQSYFRNLRLEVPRQHYVKHKVTTVTSHVRTV